MKTNTQGIWPRIRATFTEVQPNSGVPSSAASELSVLGQLPFPWLNTISTLSYLS